jgi:hypothetical protein
MGKLQLLEQTNPSAVASHGVVTVNSTNHKATFTAPSGAVDTLCPLVNNSTAQVAAGYAADTYLAGASIAIPPSGLKVGSRYVARFTMTKTAAGTATPIITVRIGTAGTIADTARLTFTFGAGTAAADSGTFEVEFIVRAAGASCVIAGVARLQHHLAVTGLTSTTGVSGYSQFEVVSSAFDATVAGLIIGLGFNGGTSFSGTQDFVAAELRAA